MAERGRVINYFPGSNTSQGFYSLYDYLPGDAQQIYIIKGGPGTGKSTLMRRLGECFRDRGLDIEYHWCSSDNEALDGLVCPGLDMAMMDGTAPHAREAERPGVRDELLDLGRFRNDDFVWEHRERVHSYFELVARAFKIAYQFFGEAREIYVRWESCQKPFDRHSVNRIARQLISEVFAEVDSWSEKAGGVRYLFASALTPDGMVNCMDEISQRVQKRYIMQGGPARAKSLALHEFTRAGVNAGLKVMAFPCAFEPSLLDMVVIPAVDTAVLNSSYPHAVEKRNSDTVLNVGTHDIGQAAASHSRESEEARELFWSHMRRGIEHIRRAHLAHDRLEENYIAAMDFAAVDEFTRELKKKILSRAAERGLGRD